MADNLWCQWWVQQFVSTRACCTNVVEQVLLVALMLLAMQGLVASNSAWFVALLVISMFIGLVSTMEVFICQQRFLFFYELEFISGGRCGWRDRLLVLWLMHTLSLWLLWPLLSFAFEGQWQVYCAILIHWNMISPAVFLLWYLMRLVMLGREYARWLGMLLLLPWIVPVLFLLLSLQTAVASCYAYSAICIGYSLCLMAVVPTLIDYVSNKLYLALSIT
mgnify:CR=1 FL=1